MAYGLNVINTSGQNLITHNRKNLVLKGVYTPNEFAYTAKASATDPRPSSYTVTTNLNYTGTELIFIYAYDQSPVSLLGAWNSNGGVQIGAVQFPPGQSASSFYQIYGNLQPWSRYKSQPEVGKVVSYYGGPSATINSIVWSRDPATSRYSRVFMTFSNTMYFVGGSEQLYCASDVGKLVVCFGIDGSNPNPNNYRVLVFDSISNTNSSGYGLQAWDASGQPIFDTSQKMLSIKAVGITPSLPNSSGNGSVIPYSTLQNNYKVAPLWGAIPSNAAYCNQNMGRYLENNSTNIFGNPVFWGITYVNDSGYFMPKKCATSGVAQTGVSGSNETFWGYNTGSYILAIDASQYI